VGAGIVHELLHKTSGARYALKEMGIKNKTRNEGTTETCVDGGY
jgi:hypothetical protein